MQRRTKTRSASSSSDDEMVKNESSNKVIMVNEHGNLI